MRFRRETSLALGYDRDMTRRNDSRGMFVGGMIVTGIGVFFLLVNLDLIPHLGKMWPLFPIIVGVALIVGSFKRSESDQSK